MKKSKFLFAKKIVILASFFSFLSCSFENSNKQNEVIEEVSALIDRHSFGVKNFVENESDLSRNSENIVTYNVEFANGEVKTFHYEKSENYVKLFETTGELRELMLSDENNGITLKKNGSFTTQNETFFDDMLATSYLANGGNLNNILAPQSSNGCIHTAISIRWRKSITVANVQNMINSYIAAHPECSQLGGIDSACTFGDFGCASVGEISCPASSSTCQ